jgi:hypothetical protein
MHRGQQRHRPQGSAYRDPAHLGTAGWLLYLPWPATLKSQRVTTS